MKIDTYTLKVRLNFMCDNTHYNKKKCTVMFLARKFSRRVLSKAALLQL